MKISLGRDRPEPPTSGQLHPAEEIFIDQPSAPPLECGIPRSPETYPLTLLIAAPTEATAPTGAFITMRVAAWSLIDPARHPSTLPRGSHRRPSAIIANTPSRTFDVEPVRFLSAHVLVVPD